MMRLQKISLGCAVVNTVYYYEIGNSAHNFKPGIYHGSSEYPYIPLAISHRVWAQGPRGGVRIIKEDWTKIEKFFGTKYVTHNPEAMKEFMWVKLKAKPLKESQK